MRLAATIAAGLLVAGCGASVLTEADYSELAAGRSAAYAAEAEELRSTQLLRLDQAVADLVRDLEPDALEEAVVSETGRRSASLFAALADAVERYADDLEAMEAPDSLLAAHLEFVDAQRLSIRDIGATIEALSSAASLEAIAAAVGGSAFNDAQYRVDAACRGLEERLVAEQVAADLNCRDDA
ncbi:MAG: hypothetical protein BMS9Abin07_1439 [Acidimicrobiia bacterium]|nr:MAG: hypothetical protein BMS9Abin07_1439 [Acidimicrobiia bacterium]